MNLGGMSGGRPPAKTNLSFKNVLKAVLFMNLNIHALNVRFVLETTLGMCKALIVLNPATPIQERKRFS